MVQGIMSTYANLKVNLLLKSHHRIFSELLKRYLRHAARTEIEKLGICNEKH